MVSLLRSSARLTAMAGAPGVQNSLNSTVLFAKCDVCYKTHKALFGQPGARAQENANAAARFKVEGVPTATNLIKPTPTSRVGCRVVARKQRLHILDGGTSQFWRAHEHEFPRTSIRPLPWGVHGRYQSIAVGPCGGCTGEDEH